MNVLDYRFPNGELHWSRADTDAATIYGIESLRTRSLRMIVADGFGNYSAYTPDKRGPTFFSNIDDARTVINRLDALEDRIAEKFRHEKERFVLRTFRSARSLPEPVVISVSVDFSATPGGRYRKHGPWSGEEFRETLLEPHFDGVLKPHSDGPKIIVDLDGTAGYSTGFLEEAFGGLIRKFGDDPPRGFRLKSVEQPELVNEVWKYVTDACGQLDKEKSNDRKIGSD